MTGTNPTCLGNSEGVRVPTRVFATSQDAVRHIVRTIEQLIRERAASGRPCVLGLPTGSTPVSVYRELVRMHKEEGLDFSNVHTFNLDEYYPMKPNDLQSYHRFMHEHLFSHINIPTNHIRVPDGTLPRESIEQACERYEQQIRAAGGIDLMLLGIGRTGHIGFNEPGSSHMSRTRLTRLDPITRRDAAESFNGEENVPTMGITMGVGSMLEARKVVLMAFGEHKAGILRRAIEGEMDEGCPASLLQRHNNAVFCVDQLAAQDLTYFKTPWLTSRNEWNPELIRRAVIWLSMKVEKAILKLTAKDFRSHNLHELLREHGPVHKLCRDVFDAMMKTIIEEPAGKAPCRALCFSPHPDDDVISMGGTLIRLQQQKHDVHIAYMTSGNVAVFDYDALRFLDFVADFNQQFGIDSEKTRQIESKIHEFLNRKTASQPDSQEVLDIKGLVRKTEATTAAKMIDIDEKNLHFLDLPFYRTGRIAKKSLGDEDVRIVYELLTKLEPQQIYVAGDLADPHGTHRICADAVFKAVEQYRKTGKNLDVWMYRGAWQEWEPHQIEMAVPMTPDDVDKKKLAIFRHESQKDRAMFPGSDDREFWQRAEARNRATADIYDQLGLPEYYAIEGFVQWKGNPL